MPETRAGGWVQTGPQEWTNPATGNVYRDEKPGAELYHHAGPKETLPKAYKQAMKAGPTSHGKDQPAYQPWMKPFHKNKWQGSIAGWSPLDGGGGGGENLSDEQIAALDSAFSHLGGYDPETGGAVDPISSGNAGFDAEEWYAENATDRQQERLAGESGPFTADGDLKDGRTVDTSSGGLETTADEGGDSSPSSSSDDSGGGDGPAADLPISGQVPAILAVGLAGAIAVRRWS